jgi:hypothetical protein
MKTVAFAAGAFAVLLAAAPLFSQKAGSQSPQTQPNSTATQGNSSNPSSPGFKGQRRQSCSNQAGISQSTMAQMKSIHQNAASQITGVCSNSSLTDQQKKAQIQQIHQNTRQQIQGLLSPQQQDSLAQCERSRNGGGAAHAAHAGGGPCNSIH